nr:RNA-directed DNA polymerase, eukaryota, reverse transcriptase zinc-binding domain protein [Tanacetum cinerariifolium]
VSKAGLEVDKAKINVISKLPPLTNIKDDENEVEKVEDSIDDNSVDGLEDLIKDLSVEKEEHEANESNSNISINIAKTGQEHLNDAFNKDTKRISLIYELTMLIEVRGSLGLDVCGSRKSLNKMINVGDFMQSHRGKYVLFGNMNEVQNGQERHGSIFSRNEWHTLTECKEGLRKQEVVNEIKNLEVIEARSASTSYGEARIKLPQDIDTLDSFEAMDTIQKARIKWDIKGEENTKFFYG